MNSRGSDRNGNKKTTLAATSSKGYWREPQNFTAELALARRGHHAREQVRKAKPADKNVYVRRTRRKRDGEHKPKTHPRKKRRDLGVNTHSLPKAPEGNFVKPSEKKKMPASR